MTHQYFALADNERCNLAPGCFVASGRCPCWSDGLEIVRTTNAPASCGQIVAMCMG